MENHQRKYITKNLVKLIKCTKVNGPLMPTLIANNFLDHPTWQRISKQNNDDFSLVNDIYYECMKTPNYDLLIECLEDSDNENAAEILKKIPTDGNPPPPANDNRISTPAVVNQRTALDDSRSSTSTVTDSCQPPPSPTTDFAVPENGIPLIVDICKSDFKEATQWNEVRKRILSPSALKDMTEENNFGIRVLHDLQAWRTNQKEKATFNKLHEILTGIDKEVADNLMQAKEAIRNSSSNN